MAAAKSACSDLFERVAWPPPLNQAQDARATNKLKKHRFFLLADIANPPLSLIKSKGAKSDHKFAEEPLMVACLRIQFTPFALIGFSPHLSRPADIKTGRQTVHEPR